MIFKNCIQMARRRGGDIYAEKKKERTAEVSSLPKGVVAETASKFSQEGRVLKGGKTRRMRGRGWRDYLPTWMPGSTKTEAPVLEAPQTTPVIGARRSRKARLTRRR